MKTDRTIWVAYYQDKGFITKSGYTDNFAKARVFNQRGHLSASVGKAWIEDGTIVPVPMKLTLDPEVMTILTLGGNPVFD